MRSHLVTVKHNFETAHRLPHIGGKCQSLHGHSWWAEWTIAGPEFGWSPASGVVVEFGEAKKRLRQWVDSRLDHGSMLGMADPLIRPLQDQLCRVFVFGRDDPSIGLDWPTVESVAELLAHVGDNLLRELDGHVVRCKVTETHVNAAEWVRS